MGHTRDDGEGPEKGEGDDRRPSAHPLGDGALSSLGGRRVTGSTSLTSLLEEPVPRRRTPVPGSLNQVVGTAAKAKARRRSEAPSDSPPVPGTREPTGRMRTTAPTKARAKPPIVAVVAGGLCLGAVVAWLAAGTGEPAPLPATNLPAVAGEHPSDYDDDEVGAEGAALAPLAPELPPPAPPEQGAPGDAPPRGDGPSDVLAELPVSPPEVVAENTWVRRNRAAEVRSEARVLYVNERWDAAREALRHSLEWDPSNVDAQRNVSRTYQREHDMNEALAWTRRAIATDPNDPRSHELLGDQLLMIGHANSAAEAYRVGLDAAPNDLRLRSRLRRMEGAPSAP